MGRQLAQRHTAKLPSYITTILWMHTLAPCPAAAGLGLDSDGQESSLGQAVLRTWAPPPNFVGGPLFSTSVPSSLPPQHLFYCAHAPQIHFNSDLSLRQIWI